jgi:NAD(P)-dependent dehydrogenase (short-subunit alcohol dehydrogenase family)
VRAKLGELLLKYGPIYALVNNASAIAVDGRVRRARATADVREQFETNVFGLMAVTRALLPSMRAARRGRIINLSSISGRVALPLLSAYAATKHAVEGLSESLRWELEGFGIAVCLVEPGVVRHARSTRPRASRRRSRPIAEYAPLHRRPSRGSSARRASEGLPPTEPGRVERSRRLVDGSASPPLRTAVGREAQALVTLRRHGARSPLRERFAALHRPSRARVDRLGVEGE